MLSMIDFNVIVGLRKRSDGRTLQITTMDGRVEMSFNERSMYESVSVNAGRGLGYLSAYMDCHMWRHISRYLDVRSWVRLCRTCWWFYDLLFEEEVYRRRPENVVYFRLQDNYDIKVLVSQKRRKEVPEIPLPPTLNLMGRAVPLCNGVGVLKPQEYHMLGSLAAASMPNSVVYPMQVPDLAPMLNGASVRIVNMEAAGVDHRQQFLDLEITAMHDNTTVHVGYTHDNGYQTIQMIGFHQWYQVDCKAGITRFALPVLTPLAPDAKYRIYLAPVRHYAGSTPSVSFTTSRAISFEQRAQLEIAHGFATITGGSKLVIRYQVPAEYLFAGDWLGLYCDGEEMGLVQLIDQTQSLVSKGHRSGHVEWIVPARLAGRKFDIRWVHSSLGSKAPLFQSRPILCVSQSPSFWSKLVTKISGK